MKKDKLIGINVRQLRERNELSQQELAEICNFSIQYLDDIEKNKIVPTVEDILALSVHLQTDTEYLLKENELNIQASVDEYIKERAEKILEKQGMDIQQAVELLLKKIVATKSLPQSLYLSQDDKETLLYAEIISKSDIDVLDNEEKILEWLNEEE